MDPDGPAPLRGTDSMRKRSGLLLPLLLLGIAQGQSSERIHNLLTDWGGLTRYGSDDAELRAVMVDHADYGSAWRQRDYDVMTSSEFKKLLDDNHVILIKWKDLKTLLN